MSEPAATDVAPSKTAVSEETTNKVTTSNENKNEKRKDDRDQNDRGCLKVKVEYVLSERPPSLGPLPPREEDEGGGDRNNNSNEDSKERKSGKKKRKGMNKKRPRDIRQDDSEKICMAVLRGEECPYGAGCRFSHDVKAFMATRLPDITQIEGGCPNFNESGFCVYGAMCRLGSCHITKTGENINKNAAPGENLQQPASQSIATNILPRDVQFQLRKKTYPFSCKRHFEKKKELGAKKEDETAKSQENLDSKEPSSSSTPVELLKTRKIIDFSNKVYVAPLTTVGNLPFRRIMKRFGADITCGEMAVGTCLLGKKYLLLETFLVLVFSTVHSI